MTPFANLAVGAGVSAAKTVAAASSASYMLSAGETASAATNTSDSSTWDDPLYMWSTGGNNIGQGLSAPVNPTDETSFLITSCLW